MSSHGNLNAMADALAAASAAEGDGGPGKSSPGSLGSFVRIDGSDGGGVDGGGVDTLAAAAAAAAGGGSKLGADIGGLGALDESLGLGGGHEPPGGLASFDLGLQDDEEQIDFSNAVSGNLFGDGGVEERRKGGGGGEFFGNEGGAAKPGGLARDFAQGSFGGAAGAEGAAGLGALANQMDGLLNPTPMVGLTTGGSLSFGGDDDANDGGGGLKRGGDERRLCRRRPRGRRARV